MLKHIIGLLEPDSGRILFEGRSLADMNSAERKDFKAKCSYMFQNTALFDSMTVYENIALPLKERRLAKKNRNRRQGARQNGTTGYRWDREKLSLQLSGGMRKRSLWPER